MWRKKDYHLFHKAGSQFGIGRICSCLPNKVCNDMVLGDDNIGVLVTETSNGDCDQIMGIVGWPLRQAKLVGFSLTLANIIRFLSTHCITKSKDKDEGIKKALYRAI